HTRFSRDWSSDVCSSDLEYVGRFEASNKVEVRARVGGFLKEVNFKDGQYVEKGQLLFVIDPEPFQIILDQSRANYAQVKALFKKIGRASCRERVKITDFC